MINRSNLLQIVLELILKKQNLFCVSCVCDSCCYECSLMFLWMAQSCERTVVSLALIRRPSSPWILDKTLHIYET